MAPYNISAIVGTLPYFLLFLLIGVAFGAVLEMSGFGDSRKLAAQFYFKEMTVLKVMFTAIIVAAVLILLSTSLGLLNFEKVWVNPTYLWPGILGGLIMGVGFIIGGFCPGTSLVAAATGKVDGIVFVLGVGFGVFIFGETVGSFEDFFNSSHMGRFMLPDLIGLSTGWTVFLLVLMALAMFYGAEIAEHVFGSGKRLNEIRLLPERPLKSAAAACLVILCFVLIFRGEPSARDKWRLIAGGEARKLSERAVYVDPAEVVELRKDRTVYVRILDVRNETDYNLFHLARSERVDPEVIMDPGRVREWLSAPENTAFFLVSNDEAKATEAWKLLKASGLVNLYIVEGGVNRWLERYPVPECVAERAAVSAPGAERLNYAFHLAVGDRVDAAQPDSVWKERQSPCPGKTEVAIAGQEHENAAGAQPSPFVRKVKLQRKVAVKGGCG